ncbi:LRR receptor-like serine/threonine-protein kinase EFR [Salvia splendens]|uniref:LRR receptor-like serine/threonine-protein kinase EFR n=1 Tax=Salvia splendens TaxID=180675 RepID=UPI001C25D9D1|nr:LRR receptor-like serine/threonine-protein kinase EFR [Salvia splendens]
MPSARTSKNPKKTRTKNSNTILIIVLPSSFAAISLLLLLVYWILRRLKRSPDSESRPVNFFPKISYQELLKATYCLSSQNLIGSGSFESVYKGTLGSDGTVVAVKVLNLRRSGAARNFLAECEALKSVRHYNLAKVYTCCSLLTQAT